jgi:hypothetical protein
VWESFVADFGSIPDIVGTGGGLVLGNGDRNFRDRTYVSIKAVALGEFSGDGKPVR